MPMNRKLMVLSVIAGLAAAFPSTRISEASNNSADSSAGTVKTIETAEEFHQWNTYYYLHPQPELMPQAILFAEKKGILNNSGAQLPMIAMMSQIFSHNPQSVPNLVRKMGDLTMEHKTLVWKALWQANTEESRKEANDLSLLFPAGHRPPLLTSATPKPQAIETMELSPGVLDMLWGSFLVTGEERFVQRIISALPGKHQKDMNKLVIAGAASWSLTSNASQHKEVMRICVHARQMHPEWKPELDEIIGKANSHK